MTSKSETEFIRYQGELKALTRRDITQGIKLAKYKKYAQSMLKRDPVAGNTLLGLIACLCHDQIGMHTCHKQAIQLEESCFSLMNYAASLQKACLWSESARYALLALDCEPENLTLLEAIIGIAPLTGRFSLLKRLLPQWQRAHGGEIPGWHRHVDAVGDLLARHGLQERDLMGLLVAIGEALSATDVILQNFSYDLVTDGNELSFLHYRFLIPDQLAASYYEDLIAAKLEGFPCHPRMFDVFSFSVENSDVYELYEQMEKELRSGADAFGVPDPDKMRLIEELVAGVEVRSW